MLDHFLYNLKYKVLNYDWNLGQSCYFKIVDKKLLKNFLFSIESLIIAIMVLVLQ